MPVSTSISSGIPALVMKSPTPTSCHLTASGEKRKLRGRGGGQHAERGAADDQFWRDGRRRAAFAAGVAPHARSGNLGRWIVWRRDRGGGENIPVWRRPAPRWN